MKIAFQGERGAFSEAAARQLLGDRIEPLPCPSFEKMFAAVTSGEAEACLAPIENSLAGSIHRNYDLLGDAGLVVRAETQLRVVHNLIASDARPIEVIQRVLSHPVALAQCTRFFERHPWMEPVAVHDTAGAVRLVVERGEPDAAAIASDIAAEVHRGTILLSGIEDHAENYTRFLLLMLPDSAVPALVETPRRTKTSILFRVHNVPGALYRALGVFALGGIDLTKIESRPVEGRRGEYSFYADLVGSADEAPLSEALDELRAMSEVVIVFGSYPTAW